MPIPDFQSLVLPLLELPGDGNEWLMRDGTARRADRFPLTEEERQQQLPSGENRLFVNRVAWATTHLKAAGLIDHPARGKVRLADEGRRVRSTRPAQINTAFLKQYPA
jgi:restriction system protein